LVIPIPCASRSLDAAEIGWESFAISCDCDIPDILEGSDVFINLISSLNAFRTYGPLSFGLFYAQIAQFLKSQPKVFDNDCKLTGNVGKRGRETHQISQANIC
jgi:hypothetical protein